MTATSTMRARERHRQKMRSTRTVKNPYGPRKYGCPYCGSRDFHEPCPSPEEIRRRCIEIRRGWPALFFDHTDRREGCYYLRVWIRWRTGSFAAAEIPPGLPTADGHEPFRVMLLRRRSPEGYVAAYVPITPPGHAVPAPVRLRAYDLLLHGELTCATSDGLLRLIDLGLAGMRDAEDLVVHRPRDRGDGQADQNGTGADLPAVPAAG